MEATACSTATRGSGKNHRGGVEQHIQVYAAQTASSALLTDLHVLTAHAALQRGWWREVTAA